MLNSPFQPPSEAESETSVSSETNGGTTYGWVAALVATLTVNYAYDVLTAHGAFGRAKPSWFIVPAVAWIVILLFFLVQRLAAGQRFSISVRAVWVTIASTFGVILNLWFLVHLISTV